MYSISSKGSSINKKVFIIALILGLVLQLGVIGLFNWYISQTEKIELPKEPVIKYVKLPPKKKKVVKKKIVKRKKAVKKKKIKRKKIGRKATAPVKSKKENLPSATVPLPKVTNLAEKEIALPEREISTPTEALLPIKSADVGKFQAVTLGAFNPTFGKSLSKYKEFAGGTAAGRVILYKPPPPKIVANTPPPTVKVRIWVNPDGTVGRVEFKTTTQDKKIDSLIWSYVKKWKFNKIDKDEKQYADIIIRFKPEK